METSKAVTACKSASKASALYMPLSSDATAKASLGIVHQGTENQQGSNRQASKQA